VSHGIICEIVIMSEAKDLLLIGALEMLDLRA
jgi:hypothetical protein